MCEDSLQLLRKEFDQVSLECISFCKYSFASKNSSLGTYFPYF